MQSHSHTRMPTLREQAILKMVIEDYIKTATPVPSRRLKEKFGIQWSPATIRKALHTLEDTGFLDHIYTSSGRVPTDYGYRFYVDELMDTAEESGQLKSRIMKELSAVASSVEKLIEVTANCLAEISRMFGFVLLDSNRNARLTDIQLVRLSSGSVLLVLGFQSDQIRTVALNLSVEVKVSHIDAVASILRERLLGLTIDTIQRTISERLKDQSVYDSEIVQVLIENREDYFSPFEGRYIFTSQKDYLLGHPEFRDSEIVHSIVSTLDNHDALANSVWNSEATEQTRTFIGQENVATALQSCSVVTKQISCGDLLGELGVIGPTRMSYRDVHTLVETLSRVVYQLLHG